MNVSFVGRGVANMQRTKAPLARCEMNPVCFRASRTARQTSVSNPASRAASATVHSVPGISRNMPLTRSRARAPNGGKPQGSEENTSGIASPCCGTREWTRAELARLRWDSGDRLVTIVWVATPTTLFASAHVRPVRKASWARGELALSNNAIVMGVPNVPRSLMGTLEYSRRGRLSGRLEATPPATSGFKSGVDERTRDRPCSKVRK